MRILKKRGVILFMSTVFVGSIYFAIVQLASNIPTESLLDTRIIQNNLINILILHSAVIIDQLRRLGYTKNQYFEILLKLAAFQGIISAISFFIPPLKGVFDSFYIAGGGNNAFVLDARIYGISSDYTFGTPIYHGLLAGVAVYYAIKDNLKKYFLYIPPIILVVLLNGRTGLVVFLMTAILFIVCLYLKRRQFLRATGAVAIVVITTIVLYQALAWVSPNTYAFITSFLDDTRLLLTTGQLAGNYEVLIGQSLHFPENVRLFFGAGYRIYDILGEQLAGVRSDIGFVNDIYMGGLLYAGALYVGLFLFLKNSAKDDLLLFNILFLVTMVANFKGEILRSAIFVFLIVYLKMAQLNELKERQKHAS